MTTRFWASSNCSHRCISRIGMSLKCRLSCGMALLACLRSYWQVGWAAQKSISKAAEVEQVVQRAQKLRTPRFARGLLKVGPIGGDQRLTAIRQNEDKLQSVGHTCSSKDLQRLS